VSPGSQPAARHGYGRALAVAAIAAGLDQLTKALARGAIEPGETIEVGAGIDLVRVANDGIAFGLLGGAGSAVLIVATLAFVALLGFFLARGDRAGLWLPIGLIVGGAVGNLVDRIRDGYVTWPAFNLADVEITVGVAILLLLMLREPAPETEPTETQPGAPAR
jgi:signal peptidase II